MTPTPQPQPSAETRAREYQQIQFEGCTVCIISPEDLATLITTSDKYDTLERSILDLSHPNLKMLLEERDALKAKAEAFAGLEAAGSELAASILESGNSVRQQNAIANWQSLMIQK